MINYRKIPEYDMPGVPKVFDFTEEPLVSISDYFEGAIISEPIYFHKGMKNAISDCKVRIVVAEMLERALEQLPSGLTFKVYDAWRPIEVQQELYDGYYNLIRNRHTEWSDKDITDEVKKFVSVPSYDPENPSVHNTGGAIDLTIVEKSSGLELPMGTEFDDFTIKAYTVYYERNNNEEIKKNRRLLYWTMVNSGFTNLPSEWWHYDYGTNFWGYYTGNPVKYKGIIGDVKK